MKKSFKKIRKTRKNVRKSVKKMGKRKTIKKYSKLQIVKASPTGCSYSSSALVYKPAKGIKVAKLLAPTSVFDNVSSFGFSSSVGKQGIADGPFPIFEGSAINALVTSGLRRLDATGSATTRPTIQTGQKNFQILLELARQEITISNASSANVEVIIYNLVAKVTKSATVSPASDWNNGIDDERSGIPNSFPSAHDAYSYYAEPTQVKRFNQNWSVLKKTVITLGVGRVHKHVFDFKPSRILDTSYTAQYNIIRGVTCSQIILSRGMPADNAPQRAPGPIISSTATKLIMMNRIRYYHRVMTPQPKIYEVSDTMIYDDSNLYIKEEDGDVINANLAANYA